MPRLLRAAGVLALALALFGLVPSPASAAPRWLAPSALSAPGESASTPRVAIGPDGAATVAWLGQAGVVRVATRAPGSAAWSAPADVSGPGAAGIAGLAVDATGAAAVLWTVPVGGPPGAVTSYAAVRPAGAPAFGPAEQVSAVPASSFGLASGGIALAGDGAGGFVVAWAEAVGPGAVGALLVSTRPAGGAWGPHEALSAPGEHALSPAAAGAGGRVVVVWTSAPPGTSLTTVRLRERPAPGQAWTAERTLSAPGVRATEPSVAAGAAGEALAAWYASTPATGSEAQAAFRPAGGEWGAAEPLGSGLGLLLPPETVIEPDGTASVVWWGGPSEPVTARVRPAGAGFGPLQELSRPGTPISVLPNSIVAAGPAGVMALWIVGESPDRPMVVRAAIKPSGAASFGPETTVSAPSRGLFNLAGGLAPNGEGVAAWIDAGGGFRTSGTLRVADYTERPGAALEPSSVAVAIDHAPSAAIEGSLIRLRLAVDGFADDLEVRLQRHTFGAFRDTGHRVTLNRQSGELPVRLDFPGKGVFRLAYESQGQAAFSRSVTVHVSRPKRPLVPAGVRPTAVRAGLGSVWVLTTDEGGETAVLRFDPRTGRRIGEATAVEDAAGLAVGAGAVWVSRGFDSDRGVVRIDPSTGAVAAEVPVVSNGAVGAGPAGVWTVECVKVLGIILAKCDEQRLARIDPATNSVSERFTVVPPQREFSPSAGGITVGSRAVWYSVVDDDRGRSSHRLDPATGAIADVGYGTGLVARGDLVWALAGRRCDLVRGRGAGTLAPRGRVAGAPRYGCDALTFDGRNLWVTQSANAPGFSGTAVRRPSRLVRLNTRTGRQVGRPIPIGIAGVVVDVRAGAVWAASTEEAVLRRIDPSVAARQRPAAARRYTPPRPRASWRRPATIPGSAARADISRLDLATGGRGRAAAIWASQRRPTGAPSIVSSIRPSATARWGAARRLSPTSRNAFAGGPQVELNAAGEGLATWVRGGATSYANSTAQVAALGRTARAWGAASTLGEPGTGGVTPRIGLADDGEAIAVWSCFCGGVPGSAALRQAIRPPGGAFGPPIALGAGAGGVEGPRLAMSPSGSATVAWGPAPGAGITASSRTAGAPFGEPVTLAPSAIFGPSGGAVAANDAGEAVAVWERDGLFAALRGRDGGWGAAERIAPSGRYSLGGPEVALDAAGNALVAVRAFDLDTFNFRILTIARRAGSATWERPFWLSPKGPTDGPPSSHAGEPSLAMSARGDAVVAWSQRLRGAHRVLARLRPAGRPAWRPLEAASARERAVGSVRAAMDAAGVATVAWVASRDRGKASPVVVRTATRPPLRSGR